MKRRMLSLLVTVAMVLGLAVTMAFAQDGAETEAVASVGDQTYTTLQNAVDNANGQTITLLQDVVLTSAVQVPAAAVTIEGKGNTITLAQDAAASCAVFNNTTSSPEGLLAGTDLTVNEVNFVSEIGGQAGHAVIVGSQGDVDVSLNGCTFTGLYDAVYCNWVGNADAELTSISITGSTFTNVAHSYGVDDGATPGGRVDMHTFTLTGNTNEPAPETFAVASVDGVGYTSLEDAMAAVSEAQDKTVTLRKDVELSSMLNITASNVVVDLGGNTITAGDSFTSTYDNDKHLVQVLNGANVTLRNGSLVTTTANKHALNVYGAENFRLENVVVDHTLAEKGAPVVVNGSTMSVGGTVELITGEKSWYAMNVDNQVNGVATASEVTFVEGANVKFSGVNPLGIYLETTHAGTRVAVSFKENVTLSSDVENFVAVSIKKDANAKVENPENANLDTDENGNLVPHEHVYGEAWMSDENGHWHVCACGEVDKVVAHTFQWVVDKEATATENGSKHEECTVCGYAKQAVVIPATGTTQPSEQPSTQPSEQPTQSQKPDAEQPQTGDVSNVALWVAMMFVSVATLTGVMAYTKKRA